MSSTPSETFSWWGEELKYCRAEYNHSGENERAVEVPIAQSFIGQRSVGTTGLEVGHVLSHYQRQVPWTVLDRYEPGATLNCDVFDFHEPVDWIVAISTLEHVRWDESGLERHPDGSVRALEHLYGLLRPGGWMLVTIPMGWHPFLDSAILDRRLPVKPTRQCTMVRDGGQEHWRQTPDLEHRRYAMTSIWAESVWVGEFSA